MLARRRPHYAPEERWRLLELRALHDWSLEDTAVHALVAPGTVARWEREAQAATTPVSRRLHDPRRQCGPLRMWSVS